MKRLGIALVALVCLGLGLGLAPPARAGGGVAVVDTSLNQFLPTTQYDVNTYDARATVDSKITVTQKKANGPYTIKQPNVAIVGVCSGVGSTTCNSQGLGIVTGPLDDVIKIQVVYQDTFVSCGDGFDRVTVTGKGVTVASDCEQLSGCCRPNSEPPPLDQQLTNLALYSVETVITGVESVLFIIEHWPTYVEIVQAVVEGLIEYYLGQIPTQTG